MAEDDSGTGKDVLNELEKIVVAVFICACWVGFSTYMWYSRLPPGVLGPGTVGTIAGMTSLGVFVLVWVVQIIVKGVKGHSPPTVTGPAQPQVVYVQGQPPQTAYQAPSGPDGQAFMTLTEDQAKGLGIHPDQRTYGQ